MWGKDKEIKEINRRPEKSRAPYILLVRKDNKIIKENIHYNKANYWGR